MRELIHKNFSPFNMFVPEYTITSQILANIATIEYGKAIIDTSKILPSWRKQLQKEARVKNLFSSTYKMGVNTQYEQVKRYVDGIEKPKTKEIRNLVNVEALLNEIARSKDLEESDLKAIHSTLSEDLIPKSKQGVFRSTKIRGKTNPDEILAGLVEFFDWFNSLDAQETHPVIKSGITKAVLESNQPFEIHNSILADQLSSLILKLNNYDCYDSLSVLHYYDRSKREYEEHINSIHATDPDLTAWVEYYTEAVASEVSTLQDKVRLLERDTKIAKATGRAKLTQRQEKIVEFIQDYGMLQNKDFGKLFPNISEDTVLRNLKVLIDKDIVVKRGSTKNSRYELS